MKGKRRQWENLFQHTKPRWKLQQRWDRGRAFRPSCDQRTCRSKGTTSPSPSPWASLLPFAQSRSVPVYPKTHNFQNEFQYPMEQTFMPHSFLALLFLSTQITHSSTQQNPTPPIPNALSPIQLSLPTQQWEKKQINNNNRNKTKLISLCGYSRSRINTKNRTKWNSSLLKNQLKYVHVTLKNSPKMRTNLGFLIGPVGFSEIRH